MRKLVVLFLLAFASVFLLASCASTPAKVSSAALDESGKLVLTYADGSMQTVDGFKSVVSAELDKDMHLIITYSDGTTEDKGYAGPAACTVTFVDYDGTILDTKSTYVGLSVTAPTEPKREDYIFAGWDKDFDKVTGDLTVTATYTAKASYTVTFKDYDGTVLKTETVVSGKDATPPATPTRSGYNFAGWQGNYTAITQNVEIVATYTEKDAYTVTFVDYNGLVLDKVTVKEGYTASTSVKPVREGYTFKGWSGSLSNITGNKTVTAQYTLVNAANIFDIAYKVSGNTVTLTLSLAGNVCLAGFEGSLSFTGMTATNVTGNSSNILANLKSDGTIALAYTSATNVTKAEKVITVTLVKNADSGKANLTIADCYDQNFEEVSYKIIGQTITLK